MSYPYNRPALSNNVAEISRKLTNCAKFCRSFICFPADLAVRFKLGFC